MDKIKHYQDLIVKFIQNYNQETGGDNPSEPVKRRILVDRKNNSFQLLATGWRGSHFIFGPIFHFDIIDEKIWIQCNNTEREIVDELLADGVPKSDIVLGFVPPQARHFSGFAVA
jgi:XisI protein